MLKPIIIAANDVCTLLLAAQAPPRPLSGATLSEVRASMEQAVPLDRLEERRRWRDDRLAALAIHKKCLLDKEQPQ